MVMYLKKYLFFTLICIIFLLSGCDVDLSGIIGSSELANRLQVQNAPLTLKSTRNYLPWGDNYSFIVLSDTHIDGGDIQKLEALKAIIDEDNVQFVVFNGDITQNGKRGDVEIFIKNTEYLEVPCYPVIGNHDIYFGNWPVWQELIGPTCYRIDNSSTTLLILDSANAYFGIQQLNWLESQLKGATGHVFVFSHTNLFVESLVDIQQFTDNRERARFTAMLKGRCDAVFMGHVHKRIINNIGGVPYITTEDYKDNTTICQVFVSPNNIYWTFRKL